MKIVIVGGVAGGMSAATRARRLDEDAEIIVYEAGDYVSFANCGLPYHLAGEIADRDDLILHTPKSLAERAGIDVRPNHRVTAINRTDKTVTVATPTREETESYDALVLSPGAEALVPPIAGADHPTVSTLRTIPEMDAIISLTGLAAARAEEANRQPRAVVLGAGFIGLETVEALVHRGFAVSLVELAPQVLPPLDGELAPLLADELTRHGVDLHLGVAATAIEDVAAAADKAKGLQADVVLGDGTRLATDLVVMSVGVRPASQLAADAGLELGERGTIRVDRDQHTSDPHIWAVGDAVEVTWSSGRQGPVLLAGPANRQGRRAADSIMGHPTTPQAPVLGTAVVRVFDLVAAVTGTGRRELTAAEASFETVRIHTPHHASYYPGSETIHLLANFAPDGRLLGAAAVGKAGIDKRIDVLATAIRGGMTADDLAELELTYSPPIGSAKDPLNMVGFVAQNVLSGLCPQWGPEDVPAALDNGLILDVRSAREWTRDGHLPGALLIPHTQMRERLAEVKEAAAGRPVYVHCASGVRSYLVVRILRAHGLEAYNFSGGFQTLCLTHADKIICED